MKLVSMVSIPISLVMLLSLSQCKTSKEISRLTNVIDTLWVNQGDQGPTLEFEFARGKSHNHPTFAIWAEDLDGNYLKTLFVTRSIATGIFNYGPKDSTSWDNKPGWQVRPATLPYWLHKRSEALGTPLLPTPQQPLTDAYSGATPKTDFSYRFTEKALPATKFRILMEINQPWDWNEHWTNTLYDDPQYRTSCQPSLVYSVMVDPMLRGEKLYMNPIGHGHYAGHDGKLYTDLRTFTTALHIIDYAAVTQIN